MRARLLAVTRPRFYAFAVVAALVVPVTFSGGELEANEACADGGCCPEMNSWCFSGGGDGFNYYNAIRTCGWIEVDRQNEGSLDI